MSTTLSAVQALDRLREGNRRFASGAPAAQSTPARRAGLVWGQAPFATVIGCSDSRVPPEIVFDQGLGDLFVIRVAGNIAGPSEIGSVEFAATQLGIRLVVVLGHTGCGAVRATLSEIRDPTENLPGNLRGIVNAIRPGVEAMLADDPESSEAQAVRTNVRVVARRLQSHSHALRHQVHAEGLAIVCGEYALETGDVEFFDGVPEDG